MYFDYEHSTVGRKNILEFLFQTEEVILPSTKGIHQDSRLGLYWDESRLWLYWDVVAGRSPVSLGSDAVVLYPNICGLDQGILGMCVGDKRKLKIPSKMGYGDHGSQPTIPGGATLIFDTELVAVNGKGSGGGDTDDSEL